MGSQSACEPSSVAGRYPSITPTQAVPAAKEQASGILSPIPPAGGLTVENLLQEFLKQYVYLRELDSARKYDTHINPSADSGGAMLIRCCR